MDPTKELSPDMHMDDDIAELLDLVTMEHSPDVADLLLGFLISMPDPMSVREPIPA